jgi:hypothetical protein
MTARDLIFLVGLNHLVFRENAAGLTHDESLRTPDTGGNCLNWVLGHVLATRHPILKVLKRDGFWPDPTVDLYKRGSQTLSGEGPGVVRWERMVEEFQLSHDRIVEALEASTAHDLAQPGGRGPGGVALDVAHRVAFLQFHEAYHIGRSGCSDAWRDTNARSADVLFWSSVLPTRSRERERWRKTRRKPRPKASLAGSRARAVPPTSSRAGATTRNPPRPATKGSHWATASA